MHEHLGRASAGEARSQLRRRPVRPPADVDTAAGDRDAVIYLQQAAGNGAVALAVQADRGQGGSSDRQASARFEAFMTDYPGIAAAMSFEQLKTWRDMLGGYEHNRGVDAALTAHERNYRKNAWDPTVPFIADSRYQDRHQQIEEGRTFVDEQAGRAPLDPNRILGPDVAQIPGWNVAAEKRFREWAVKTFIAQPLTAELTSRRELVSAMEAQQETARATGRPHVNLWWGRYALDNTNGIVTFDDLLKIPSFAEEYRNQVSNGPEIKALRTGLNELHGHINQMLVEHKDLSDRNAGADQSGWVRKKIRGGVRHISEGLGAPSAIEIQIAKLKAQAKPDDDTLRAEYVMLQAQAGDYPKMDGPDGIWFLPQEQLAAADRLFQAGQIEVAAAALQAAEASSAESTIKFAGYERRVMSGAGVAVTWLNRAKTAGKIASAFTGVSGVVQASAMAAGYTAVQEGVQEASTKFFDPSHEIEWKRVAQQSAIDGLMGLFGGLTQGAFTKALNLRFGAKIAAGWNVSSATAERALGFVGATTSSFYNVPAKIVLDNIIAGKAAPHSFAEVADMVTEEAATSVGMEALGGFVHSASTKAPPDAETGGKGQPDAATKTGPADQPTGKTTEAPKAGGGPGEQRIDLADALAGGKAGGEPTMGAPGRAAPGAALAARPAGKVTAEAARLAQHLEPLVAEWATLKTPEARGQKLLDMIYEQMAPTGLPKPTLKVEARSGGMLAPEVWQIKFERDVLAKDNVSAEDFAQVAGLMKHELEHGLDWFRLARQQHAATNESARDLAIRLGMPVKEMAAAIEANRGERPGEDMRAGSEAATRAQATYESVYGTGRAERQTVLKDLEIAWAEIERAKGAYDVVKDLPETDPMRRAATREFWEAWERSRPIEEKYMALPEEVVAYKAGDALTQAIRERGVMTRLETMRRRFEQADRRLQPLRETAASVEGKPGRTLSLDERQAFNRALGDWMTTMHAVRKLEAELAAVQRKASP